MRSGPCPPNWARMDGRVSDRASRASRSLSPARAICWSKALRPRSAACSRRSERSCSLCAIQDRESPCERAQGNRCHQRHAQQQQHDRAV